MINLDGFFCLTFFEKSGIKYAACSEIKHSKAYDAFSALYA